MEDNLSTDAKLSNDGLGIHHPIQSSPSRDLVLVPVPKETRIQGGQIAS